MSTINRHTLKKAHQSRRKPTVQPSGTLKRSRSPFRPALRSIRRLSRKPWLWFLMVMLIAFIGFGSWYSLSRGSAVTTSNASQALTAQQKATLTPSPTPIRNWQTVQTFTGSDTGSSTRKLKQFTVKGPWQLGWNCQGINGVDQFLYISIYNPDGSIYNAGAQVTCIAANPVEDSVVESKGGPFYLAIDSNTNWTVTVKEPASS